MFIKELSDRGLAGEIFERLMYAAAIGAACGASAACSGFSSDDCMTSRTCPPSHGAGGGSADVDSGSDSGNDVASGGSLGNGGSGNAAGAGGRVETGGAAPTSTGGTSSGGTPTTDAGSPDGASDAGAVAPVEAGPDAEIDAGPLVCTDVVADCNHDRGDACETSLLDDVTHCGSCDKSCSQSGTSAVACQLGVCKPTCDTTHADCNMKPDDACEVTTATDVKNCGKCGDVCGTVNTSVTACVSGKCKATCAGAFADCNAGTAAGDADGCESNVQTSPTNCGVCGRNCQGGPCVNGTCRPFVVATHLNVGTHLAVDSKYAYYADSNPIVDQNRLTRVPIMGGATTVIGIGTTNSIATDGTHLYFSTLSEAAGNAPVDGALLQIIGDKSVSFESQIDPWVVAVDAKNAYWFDGTASSINFKPHATPTAAASHLTEFSAVMALASDGASLFGLSDAGHTLFAVPVPAGQPKTTIGSINSDPLNVVGRFIALDATSVYAWFTDASLGAHLWRLSKAFAPINEVASSAVFSAITQFAVSGGQAYVAAQDGIHRVPIDGTKKTLNDAPIVATSQVAALTVVGGALYWIDSTTASDGDLVKLAIF